MKLETLKLCWKRLSPRGRTATAAGIVALCLAGALANGIGAGDASGESTSSLGNAKIDLKETDRAYSVTISTPESEQSRLNIRMEGRNLVIGSAGTAGGVALEQRLRLPEADPKQAPTFERQEDRLVVTVSKRSAAQASVASVGHSPHFNAASNFDDLTSQMFGNIRQMQQQMDRMMSQAMSGMGRFDAFSGFGGMSTMSSLNLEDKGNEYVIRATLPGDALNNVNVSVDNERVLKITANDESSGAHHHRMSNVTQVFTLPGPVQSDKIQIDQSQDALVITLPKA